MTVSEAQFVVNAEGERVAVLLDVATYERILDDLEELEAVRAFDAAKASKDEVLPFEEAVDEIERGQRQA